MKTITIKTTKGLEPVIIPKHNIPKCLIYIYINQGVTKKTALFLLLICVAINTASAQVYSKIGDKPGHLDPSAVLEIASTKRGFLPPRMEKTERDAISVSPEAVGLQVWCTNCNTSTKPPSGQLCVYLGKDAGWAPFTMLATSALTTAGNNDVVTADRPVRKSANSATISGTLAEIFGSEPTETGIVWREISGGDFAALPVFNALGTAVAPNYNTPSNPAVTKANSPIKVTISDLNSANPYYFRTYAKSLSGIGYGNAVIFNPAPPKISKPVIINENTLLPVFAGKLTVNAGTPRGTITEYGYCSGTTNPPTVANDKVVLSNANTIALLNSNLNSETFTANPPAIDLAVNDYNVKTIATTYFRYYAVVNGETEPVYSDAVSFTPVADPITGGTAVATVTKVDNLITESPLQIGVAGSGTIRVHFDVSKAGIYADFAVVTQTGPTTGLSIATVPSGHFNVGNDRTLNFTVSGTPSSSVYGTSFAVSRITPTLDTGAIKTGNLPMVGANATCDPYHTTTVVDIHSPTGATWMDRNLGASQAASSVTDYNAYGCLYQWGRGNDGHASITWKNSTTGTPVNDSSETLATTNTPGSNFILSPNYPRDWLSSRNDNLWQESGGTNNPCPFGYRVPTSIEFNKEFDAYSIANDISASSLFTKLPLKLTLAGGRHPSGDFYGTGIIWLIYWESTTSGTNARAAANNDYLRTGKDNRASGMSVRCIKN